MDTTPTKLPTVPKHYICATCNIVGNHWIMHCPSMKANSKALSLDINILNPPSKLNISIPPNASVDSLLKTITPFIQNKYLRTPCMTTLHPDTNLQDYKISNGTSNDSHIQLTPSHKRNVTRNCDEFRVDDIGSDNNYDISDDESVISPNSNIIHHREITKTMDINNTNENFDNDDENESDVYEYWDNLKLKQTTKKSVDKQRLREILNNLPSGSIIDRESSVEYDDNELEKPMLHSEKDTIAVL